MRIEKTTRELYPFNELDDDVKQKAIENLYDLNVDFDFENMEQVKNANKKSGMYFFSKPTMRFFNSIIETELMEGGFFITSERYKLGLAKRYTIRQVTNEQGHIASKSDFQEFKTIDRAIKQVEILQLELLASIE